MLFDVVEPGHLEATRRNIVDRPEGMVQVGSPFAALYLYDALEKLGREDVIVEEINRNDLPMLEVGATTVWESFPGGTTGFDGFPTRSHGHAWSSAPNYFLPRILLGIKPVTPGARSVQISPRPAGLTWAQGTVATIRGPISVAWVLEDQALQITSPAPEGIAVEFVRNDSLARARVASNDKALT